MDQRIIAIIEKTRTTDLRVRLVEFNGRPFIDVRVFIVGDAVERTPTRKGVAIPPSLLRGVIEALKAAEEEVQERGIPYEIGVGRFRETSRGHIMGLEHGFVKMLVSLKTRRLLGVQIVGEGATELIHIAQAVLNLKGTVDYFVENTFNYPTLAEAYRIAGLDAFNRMPIPEEYKVKGKVKGKSKG